MDVRGHVAQRCYFVVALVSSLAYGSGCGGTAPKGANPPSAAAEPSAAARVEVRSVEAPKPDSATDDARSSLHLLVTPEPLVVFRDRRRLTLGRGGLRVSLHGVLSDLDPTSVTLRTLTPGAELALMDVRFYGGSITPQALLAPYLGKQVSVYASADKGPGDKPHSAILLGISDDGPVVALEQQVRVLDFGQVAVPRLPEGLRAEPTLELLVTSDRSDQDVELTYTSHLVEAGMEYQLVRAPGEGKAQLVGLVGVANQSTSALRDAFVSITSDATAVTEFAATESADRAAGARPEPPAAEATTTAAPSTSLVRLATALNLAANERALVHLFGPTDVTLTRKVVVEGPGLPVNANDDVSNASIRAVLDAASTDGKPLSTQGLIGGNAHLLERAGTEPPRTYGAAAARPLPAAKGIRVDLAAENKYPSQRRMVSWRSLGRCVTETTWDVSVGNPTESPLLLEDVEPVTGKYELLESNVPAIAKEADHFAFALTVQPKSENHLKFRVKTSACVPARRHYWQEAWGKSLSKRRPAK